MDPPPGAGDGVLQRGLIGAVRLAPPEARIVLPHEDVMPGPVLGRRQLMEATQANLEPIFLLYDGGPDTATGPADRRGWPRPASPCSAPGPRTASSTACGR